MEEKDRTDILGKDLIVALQVYEESVIRKSIIYFSELVKILKGRVSRIRINQAIDRLFDQGILTAEWAKKDGKWIRSLKPANEAKEFLKNIYIEVMIKYD